MLQKFHSLLHRDEVLGATLIALAAISLILLFALLIQALRLKRLARRLEMLTRGVNGASLESTLNAHLDAVQSSQSRVDHLEKEVERLQIQLPNCLQKANLLRYDAFEDVGGEQSFALALLDGKGEGVVLSTMFSRADTRVYAKSIREGKSSHSLSREEETVVRK